MHARTLALTLALATVAPAALAQPRGDDLEAQHAQGNRLREQGRHAEARDLFRGLYERSRDPRALVRQGLAEMALSEWVPADEHLRTGLAVTDNRWINENRARIQGALREVEGHLGSLAVDCQPVGATVTINGERRGTCPLSGPVRLAVGDATVQVEATGHEAVTAHANVAAGAEATTLRIALRPVAPAWVDDSAEREAEASNRRRAVMLGVGAAALGLGVVGLGVGAAGYLAEGSTPGQPLSETMGIVGFAAGGALVVTGAVLLIVAPSRREVRRTAWVPACGPALGGRGLGCALTF